MKKSVIAIIMALVVALLCFSACGNQESDTTNRYDENTYDSIWDDLDYYDTMQNILSSTIGKTSILPDTTDRHFNWECEFAQFNPKSDFAKKDSPATQLPHKMLVGKSYIDKSTPVYVVFDYTKDDKEEKHVVIVGDKILFDNINFENTHNISDLMQEVKDYCVPVKMPKIDTMDNINYVGNKLGTRAYASISKDSFDKIPYIALYRWFNEIHKRDYDYFTLWFEGSETGLTLSGGNPDLMTYGTLDSEGRTEEGGKSVADKGKYYVLTDDSFNPLTSLTEPYGINGI